MLVYFSVLAIIMIICAFPSSRERNNNVKLFLSIALIFFFMALRVDFGGDYVSYLTSYNKNDFNNPSENIEIGFAYLNKLMPSFRMLLVVTSLLFSAALFFLFKRYISPKYWMLAFFILFISKYLILGNMSGIRNGMAVSAFIFGFYFLENNKKIAYVILLVLASLFHASSLFFLPVVLITPNKLSKIKTQMLWLFIFLFALISTFFPNTIELISFWIITHVSFFSKYAFYMNNGTTFGFRGLSFILIFFMIYENISTLKNKNLTSKQNLFIKISILFYIVMLLPGIGLLSRMYFYLGFPQLVGNIYVMSKIRDLHIKWAYIFGMLVLPLMEFYNFMSSPGFKENLLYYHSILFH